MYLDRITSTPEATQLVAANGLAATQWEQALAAHGAGTERAVWPSPALTTFSRWLAETWEAARRDGRVEPDLCRLGAVQAARLWQRVIEESDEGAGLISTPGVAAWARIARRSLFDFGLLPDDQTHKGWRGDAAAFLRWNRRFEHLLDAGGWIDPDSLLYRLNRLPGPPAGGDLLFLDPLPDTPELDRLQQTMRATGHRVETVIPDDQQASSRQLLAADPTHELHLAGEWAAQILAARPRARLAVVIPDLGSRPAEVERLFGEHLDDGLVWSADGTSVRSLGLSGAAMSALRLLAPGADFGLLSRCLRSPFFSLEPAEKASSAASVELALRRDPRAGQGFTDAYRRHGLRRILLEQLPDFAGGIDRCLERLPERATPTTWTAIWQFCLKALGWRGFEAGLADAQRAAWDAALAEFAQLTPITGTMGLAAALDEFGRLLRSRSISRPPTLAGVHLMSRIEEVGPGYAGAWIAGFTDQAWSEPAHPNPLVPWSVRTGAGMPGTRPEETLAAARRVLERLFRRVPEAVFSCPKRVLDQPRIPNPHLVGWTTPERAESVRRPTGTWAARVGARVMEELDDPAPPLEDNRVPGGTRALDLQSVCPLKAFCVARLGAEPLEPPARGIDPRRRGLLVHRVLERLLDPTVPGDARGRLEATIAAALAEGTARGDAVWEVLLTAERTRIARLVEAFLDLETRRPAHTTLAVERRERIEIGGRLLDCRIDRIDAEPSGGEWLIDYKTGRRPVGGWFGDRLGDVQLPLYAQHAGGRVSGIVVATLADDGARYQAAGIDADAFPGRQLGFDAPAWAAQLERWREQLATLVREFAAGDVRIRADRQDEAAGAFAAVSRIRSLER